MSGRQELVDRLQHGPGQLLRLAHGQAADAVARKVHGAQRPGALPAQVGVDAALHDAEEGLIGARVGGLAALGPAVGALHGRPGVGLVGLRWRALVEGHDDVGTQLLLDLDGSLRREAVERAVDVRLEDRALLVQATQVPQAKDLEAAAVGEDRVRPAHEAVQPAQRGDDIGRGRRKR